jgi:hypothetical protein
MIHALFEIGNGWGDEPLWWVRPSKRWVKERPFKMQPKYSSTKMPVIRIDHLT